jgi:23S rRNA-/tRNA-specific pseudouridylate synthase
VHTKSIGHPVFGDHVYGPRKHEIEKALFGEFKIRQLLHAKKITINGLKFEAKLPKDLELALKNIKS